MITEDAVDCALWVAERSKDGSPEYTAAWRVLGDYVFQSNREIDAVISGKPQLRLIQGGAP